MDFDLATAVPVLRNTPAVLRALVADLPPAWTTATEGEGTWSAYDVLGHLIHGERTDWIPRAVHLLRHGTSTPFPPFDREAMRTASGNLTLCDLVDTFARLRAQSIAELLALGLTDADLARRGVHPEFGEVTLGAHLATWVAHDLTHVAQITRVMAHQYREAVGPWQAYLSILRAAPRA